MRRRFGDYRGVIPLPRIIALSLLLALLLGPAPASAQRSRLEARELLQQGNKLFGEGQYGEALRRFRRARQLYPSFKIDYNIASTLRALGRLAQAARNYERFLREASGEAPAETVKAAQVALAELRKQVATVRVECPVDEADVEVDGEVVGRTPLRHKVYLAPGPHRLTVVKPGYPQHVVEQRVQAGDRLVLLVPWGENAVTPRPLGPDPDKVAATRREARSKTVWAYSSLAAGLALAAGAGTLYGVGMSRGNAAHDEYQTAGTTAEFERLRGDLDRAETLLTVGHVLAGAAVVALGLSIYQFVTRPDLPDEAEAEPRAADARFGLSPLPGGGLVSVGGRF